MLVGQQYCRGRWSRWSMGLVATGSGLYVFFLMDSRPKATPLGYSCHLRVRRGFVKLEWWRCCGVLRIGVSGGRLIFPIHEFLCRCWYVLVIFYHIALTDLTKKCRRRHSRRQAATAAALPLPPPRCHQAAASTATTMPSL